jgi:hypothetical protein
MSLTSELDRPGSVIRRYLRDRFPLLPTVQAPYREATAGRAPMLPAAGAKVAYGTLGTAFDWRVRFLLHPQPNLHLAFLGALSMGRGWVRLAGQLIEELGGSLHFYLHAADQPRPRPWPATPPAIFTSADPGRAATLGQERLARACYALALLTEVFRAGLHPGSRLATLKRTASLDQLLELASDAEVADLLALTEAARRNLLPALAARSGPLHLGPTFAGSLDVRGADADVIAGGLLLEVKVQLGDRTPDSRRRCSLHQRTMHELIGYALLDYDDTYQLDGVAVYAARYGHLAYWPLRELLAQLAGSPVDLDELREEFRAVTQTRTLRSSAITKGTRTAAPPPRPAVLRTNQGTKRPTPRPGTAESARPSRARAKPASTPAPRLRPGTRERFDADYVDAIVAAVEAGMKVVTVAQLIGQSPGRVHRILDRHLPDRWTRYGRPRPQLSPEQEAPLRRDLLRARRRYTRRPPPTP